MLKKKSFFITCLVFISVFVFAQEDLQDNVASEIDKSLQTNFIILESDHPHDLNPHTTSYSTDSQVLNGLYEGLFTYNPVTLEPQYAIATEYRLSRDKKRMTFKIRENAFFSNGEQITAHSVRMSWIQLLLTPEAPYSSLLDIIRGAAELRSGTGNIEDLGIYATDDFHLSVYLKEPANYLPKVLCHTAFSVIHQNPTVYSGAFYLENQEPGYLLLKKNPFYWDKENTPLEHITFIQSADPVENTFLYNSGAVDWIASDAQTDKIINNKALQFTAEFGTSYYFFKTSKGKINNSGKFNPWDYPEFRNAVLEAFPWELMRNSVLVPATTLVFPLTGYPQVDGFSYTDLIEAQHLISEAKEKYGLSAEERIPLLFDITEGGISEDKEQALVESLSAIGVDLTVRKIPASIYFNLVRSSEADLFAYTWIGDFADPLAFLELFKSDSSLNDSGWQNAAYDEMLSQAAQVNDEERYKILAQAETLLLDQGMVIPVYHPVSFNIINLNEVGGWASNAFDLHPLKYLYKKHYVVKMPNVVKK